GRRLAKLPLAVQLVEQSLELFIGDFVANRRLWSLGCRRMLRSTGVDLELPFTMQLIEQGLEFGIGDFIARSAGIGGRRIDSSRTAQRTEQLLELMVGSRHFRL